MLKRPDDDTVSIPAAITNHAVVCSYALNMYLPALSIAQFIAPTTTVELFEVKGDTAIITSLDEGTSELADGHVKFLREEHVGCLGFTPISNNALSSTIATWAFHRCGLLDATYAPW